MPTVLGEEEPWGEQATEGDVRVLSSTQLAILGAEVWSPDPSSFTVVSSVRVKGVPDWTGLADAAEATLSRHDVFTWRLSLDDDYRMAATGGPLPDEPGFALEHVDLTGVSLADAETSVDRRLEQERRRAISLVDPSDRPYTKVILFLLRASKDTGCSGICALVTHHAFIDEHSADLIWGEIFRRAAGRDVASTYDRRYARWAGASVSGAAKSAAVQAASEIVDQLRAGPLGSIGGEQRSAPVEVPGSPLWFAIPERLASAVASWAGQLGVPASTVYSGAWIRVLCGRTSVPRLAITTPIALRRELSDADVVGCYVSVVPLLAEVRENDSPEVTIRRWHDSLMFGEKRGHADVESMQRMLDGVQRFTLTFETRSSLRAVKPIKWKVMPPPDSYSKSSVSMFLSPPCNQGPGDGRLLWRTGVLTESLAREMVAEFLERLARFSSNDSGGAHVVP